MKHIILTLGVTFILLSCNSTTDIKGFNEDAWKHDKAGCDGLRNSLKADLISVKDELKGLDNDEIVSVLGKPNKTQLGKRNQKHFIYNISPGESCQDFDSTNSSTLTLRFNAIGLVNEVIIL